jgi:diguanylate cyclase (GGDEF)-like protein/PAS domain S-box-containing protein
MVDISLTSILYMEDDPGLARLLQKHLERRGYVVETAADGIEGLAKLETFKPDLLLVDYNMPFCGGIDVIRALSEKDRLIPVIMVTGQGNEEVAVEALKLGAADYIVKDPELKYLELLPVVIDRVRYQQHIINERLQMESAVHESEERYRLLVELAPDGIAVHIDDKITFINHAGVGFLGASSAEQLIGKGIFELIHPDYREIAENRMRVMGKQRNSVPWIHSKFIRMDGSEIDVEVAAVSFTYQGKTAVQEIFRDITERRLAEERMKRLALYDTLTGLPNRTLFFDRLNQLLALAKRNHYILALLYLDFDRFKVINDTLGHEAGDQLLAEASRRMTSCTRKADTVARMSGDEFIGICGKIASARDAGVVAQKIIEVLSAPFKLKGAECTIGASIGISLYPHDGDDLETLVKKADIAMYRIKETGKGGFAYYSTV